MGPARRAGCSSSRPSWSTRWSPPRRAPRAACRCSQFALAELWEARDAARRSSRAGARAARRRDGALARHADGVIAALPSARARRGRRILHGPGDRGGHARAAPEAELAAGGARSRAALQALLRGRLLVGARRRGASSAGYEIAHEALLGGWDTLRGWLGRDAEKRALRHRIERAAAEWERLGRGVEGLWAGRQLEELERVDGVPLGLRERDFIEASTRLRRRRRRLQGALLLALPALLVLGLVGLRVRAQRDRDRAVEAQLRQGEAALAEARALAPQLEARRQEAFANFDQGAWDAGEAAWSTVRRLTAERDAAYWHAGSAIEAALQLHPTREDLRARYADLLLLRIEAAEASHRVQERAELLERLAAYDPAGTRRARLERPVALNLRSRPGGAQVRLFRYDASGRPGPRWSWGPPRCSPAPHRPAPTCRVQQRSGPGAAARVCARGHPAHARGGPARQGQVPPGFLYVPRGTSASASAATRTCAAASSAPPRCTRCASAPISSRATR